MPYRLRTVRIGVVAQLFVVIALMLVPLFGPTNEWNIAWYVATLVAGLVGIVAIAFLPWARLFELGHGVTAMYIWSVADILLITSLVLATGGATSPMWSVFALTSMFFAASYPPRGQVGLLVFTVAAFTVSLAVTGELRFDGLLLTRLTVLTALTYMASFLSRELMGQMSAHAAERDVSQRRAASIAQVAEASRAIHDLDADVVLRSVVEAAAGLGYEAAGVARIDGDTVAIVEAIGLPAEFVGGRYPYAGGPVDEMLAMDRFVVSPLDPARPFGALGYGTLVAAPIRVNGVPTAFIGVAARRQPRAEDDLAAESLVLLAEVAGRALENVSAFEREREAVVRLQRLDALKSDFISNASHELRTPTTVVYGLSQTLTSRQDQLDDASRDHLLRRLLAAAETLKDTVTTLIDFARIESGQLTAAVAPVDLHALITTVVGNLVEVLAHHEVAVDVPPDAVADADRVLLERALENLLVNASRYTPAGTRIHVQVTTTGDEVAITVADDGPGIPADELPHLTDRFFRGGDPNTRPTRGLGLGLAFVSDIAAVHGGRLDVQSTEGAGASFTLALPVVRQNVLLRAR